MASMDCLVLGESTASHFGLFFPHPQNQYVAAVVPACLKHGKLGYSAGCIKATMSTGALVRLQQSQ
uniref:Uncharacterized protein n=1 Tax=Anguilla anguilla TaxID=7936 RepID=A0A0E9Q927_ANGAN